MNARAALAGTGAELSQEDRARADFYALISRLFHAGPDAGLLAAIAHAGEIAGGTADAPLAQAWKSLTAAAAAMEAEAAQEEYDNVFVGTGKAEITPYASHYLAATMKENALVRLRAELSALGLAREPGAAEYEDHFSGLCEVMRHLIGASPDGATAQKQEIFFTRYLVPCYSNLFDAVIASPNTDFYRHVGRFTKAFLDLESEYFDTAQ